MPIPRTPPAIIAILSVVIESKGAPVEFHWVFSTALTRFHEALFEVSARNGGGTGIASGKNPTPVPKRIPPIEMIGPGSFDVLRVHLADAITHLALPIRRGAGLCAIRRNETH